MVWHDTNQKSFTKKLCNKVFRLRLGCLLEIVNRFIQIQHLDQSMQSNALLVCFVSFVALFPR